MKQEVTSKGLEVLTLPEEPIYKRHILVVEFEEPDGKQTKEEAYMVRMQIDKVVSKLKKTKINDIRIL